MKRTLAARSALDEFSASLPAESLHLSIDMCHADSAARVGNATLQEIGEDDYQHTQKVRIWMEKHPKHSMLPEFLQADDPCKMYFFKDLGKE